MCQHSRVRELWASPEYRRWLRASFRRCTADLCSECGRVVRVRLVGLQLEVYGAFDWPSPRRSRKRAHEAA